MEERGELFWKELFEKVEAAVKAGNSQKSVLAPLGIRDNTYWYNCLKYGFKKSKSKKYAAMASAPKAKFIDVLAKEPSVEIAYKGAVITLKNPTSEALKIVLNSLES